MPISQYIPPPANDDDFESLCLELLRRFWNRPGLALYAKRGESQSGVDILDLSGDTRIYAAQCKLKEPHKSLPPAEIQEEVDKARRFELSIGKYALLTTGKISAQSQRRVAEINAAHVAQGLFDVELFAWDRLSALLQSYPDIFEQFYGDIVPSRAGRIENQLSDVKVTILNGFQSFASKEAGSAIDAQIDEARDQLTSGEFQIATLLLNRIQRAHAEGLSPRQKFRILSNHGGAALGSGKSHLAAQYFLEALHWQPEDEKGKINEVFAYFITGDIKTSHDKATVLRSQYPNSTRLIALWVSTAEKDVKFEFLNAAVNSILRTDPEVALALSRRALVECSFEAAREHAKTAAESAPRWSQPHITIAQIDMGVAFFGDFRAAGNATDVLEAAEDSCSKALTLARAERDCYSELTALTFRSEIRLLLNRHDAALDDARLATQLDSEDAGAAVTFGQALAALGRLDEANAVFRTAFGLNPRPDVAFILARSIRGRGRDSDVDEALRILLSITLDDIPMKVRAPYVMEIMQVLSKKADWLRATEFLRTHKSRLSPFNFVVFEGYLAHYQGAASDALFRAKEALTLSGTEEIDTQDYLAQLFMLLGRPADALPLWREAFERGRYGFDPANYLNCAAALRRDDLVMAACEKLRERKVDTWELLSFELPYLVKYNIEAAIARVMSFIDKNPENKLARLRLSLIGMGLNRLHLVHAELDDLPTVTELPPDFAVPAIGLLRFAGSPTVAVDYAYRFLREHFNDLEAHRALVRALLPGASNPDIPPSLDTVEANAAVCYQENPDGTPTWVVLEDTTHPSGNFEEIPADGELAGELLGKKVGDTVILAKGQVQDRTARIVQIVPKYVRRSQDSLQQMQIRFGPASGVESVRIWPTADDPTGLKPILAPIEARSVAIATGQQLYTNNPLPLHIFGVRFSDNAYTGLASLAGTPEVGIKCCFGTPEERFRALQDLQSATAVIVDLTALCTLRLLGLSKVLLTTKYKLVVAERTIVELNEMLVNAYSSEADGGYLGFRDGKYTMLQMTAQEKADQNRQDREFIKLLETVMVIENAASLAALDPEKRETITNAFGPYGAEAMILASFPNRVLWTDDLIQAQVAASEFGVRRAWTQVILETLADAGMLTAEEFSDACARLVGMGFLATQFSGAGVLSALRLADWSKERYPALQMMAVLSEMPGDNLIGLCADYFLRLYREPVSPPMRCVAARAVFEALAARFEANAQLLMVKLSLMQVFGLNVVGADQFNACFDSWIKQRGEPLVIGLS
jgi:tetratricopeptide (TPR) repeat protein